MRTGKVLRGCKDRRVSRSSRTWRVLRSRKDQESPEGAEDLKSPIGCDNGSRSTWGYFSSRTKRWMPWEVLGIGNSSSVLRDVTFKVLV